MCNLQILRCRIDRGYHRSSPWIALDENLRLNAPAAALAEESYRTRHTTHFR